MPDALAWALMAVPSGIIALGLLVVSGLLLKREGSSMSALGLPTDARRAREFGVGFAIGMPLFLAVAWAQSAMVGASWQFQGASGAIAALSGLVTAATMVLAEELLFRGAALRYLRRLSGDWGAIIISALLFGAYHLIGSNDWAMGAFFRFLTSTLGGVLFAWAAVRSGGLALPIGLHLGGNWVQASLARFTTTDAPGVFELWRIPISADDVRILTAPDVLPRVPYFLAIGVASLVTWMIRRARPAEAR